MHLMRTANLLHACAQHHSHAQRFFVTLFSAVYEISRLKITVFVVCIYLVSKKIKNVMNFHITRYHGNILTEVLQITKRFLVARACRQLQIH
jgi:hypothetical protein